MTSPLHVDEPWKTMRGNNAIEAKITHGDANVSCFQFRPLDAHRNGGEMVHLLEDWYTILAI